MMQNDADPYQLHAKLDPAFQAEADSDPDPGL
jgi:hypothetical protein